MRLENLLDLSTKGLGLRFSLVSILPTTFLVLFTLAHLWSMAPAEPPQWDRLVQNVKELGAVEGALLILVILVVALVLQPLQLSLVRILEGYWGISVVGETLSRWGVALHKRRRRSLEQATRTSKSAAEITIAEHARMATAAWNLRRSYPSEEQLLPTALGNVLRAAEEMPAKRYGLDAVVVWPRLYPLLSGELRGTLADQRNQIDMASRFCAVFLLAALVSLAFLWQHDWWLLVPAATVTLAWLSYQAAIAAAAAYGESVQAAFDLHRFDLLKALHLPLPADRESERKANRAFSDFLRQGVPVNFHYEHQGMDSKGGKPLTEEDKAMVRRILEGL